MFVSKHKTVFIFTKLSVDEFKRELQEAVKRPDFINIIRHRDTVEFLKKLTDVPLEPNFTEIQLDVGDKMYLVVVKGKHKQQSVEDAYKRGLVKFYRVEVVV